MIREALNHPGTSTEMGPHRLIKVQPGARSPTSSTLPHTAPQLTCKDNARSGESRGRHNSGCQGCLLFVWVHRELANMVC